MPAEVAQAGGTETGVADCVQQHIRIRMPEQAFSVRYFYPAEN